MKFGPVRSLKYYQAWEKAFNDPEYNKRKQERKKKIEELEKEDDEDFKRTMKWYLNN